MNFIAVAVLLGLAWWMSGRLFSHKRLLTYVAVTGVLFEGLWLLTTWLERVMIQGVFTGVGVAGILLLAGILGWRGFMILAKSAGMGKWQRLNKWNLIEHLRRDIPVLILLAVVFLAAWSVGRINGYQDKDGSWINRGFYNGDTTTLMALVNRSFGVRGLVSENPWAENLSLEYPTLLHAGIANFFLAFNDSYDWEFFLDVSVLAQIVLTIPLFFLLWDVVWPEPSGWWHIFGLQGVIVVYVVMLAWDNYVYAQSHFYLTGLFLLTVILLAKGWREKGWRQSIWVGPGVALASILIMCNAVTGTAAAAVAGVFAVLRMLDEKRPSLERGVYLVILAGIVAVFMLATPGNAALRIPNGFSYTAVGDLMKYAPILAIVLVGILQGFAKQTFLSASAIGLILMSFFVFVFSSREIVAENSSRFIYHAVLVVFPLILPPATQAIFWLKRELFDSTLLWGEKLVAMGTLASVLLIAGWPAIASVASAHDNLMRKDEHRISFAERDALEWIRYNTNPGAVFLADPNAPFVIPQFTGRSMTRANYWLSREDEVLENVNKIYAGDFSVWPEIAPHADFVYIRKTEKEKWAQLGLTQIIDNNEIVIYKAR